VIPNWKLPRLIEARTACFPAGTEEIANQFIYLVNEEHLKAGAHSGVH
jgi:hypothetical protein